MAFLYQNAKQSKVVETASIKYSKETEIFKNLFNFEYKCPTNNDTQEI